MQCTLSQHTHVIQKDVAYRKVIVAGRFVTMVYLKKEQKKVIRRLFQYSSFEKKLGVS